MERDSKFSSMLLEQEEEKKKTNIETCDKETHMKHESKVKQ